MRDHRLTSRDVADQDDVACLIALFEALEPDESVWDGIEAAIVGDARRAKERRSMGTSAGETRPRSAF